MRRKRKHKSPKKLSKNRVKKFGETLGEKTEVEIFEEVKKAVETRWKKPLRLHEDTVEVMWAATRSDAGISCTVCRHHKVHPQIGVFCFWVCVIAHNLHCPHA